MLYIIYGTNTSKVRAKQKELISIMQSKQPNVSLYKVNSENWNNNLLDELLSSQGLFLSKYIVVLDKICDNKEISSVVLNNLKNFKESDHAWIIVEEKFSATDLKRIEKQAYKIFDFNNAVEEKKQKINAFDFAEQFASKNKAGTWKEFQKLRQAELVGEEIHGVLWWQMKALFLAKNSKNAGETGLTPYSYQKAQRLSSGFDAKELSKLLDRLVEMYHEAHRGNVDLLIALEQEVLSL